MNVLVNFSLLCLCHMSTKKKKEKKDVLQNFLLIMIHQYVYNSNIQTF